MVAGTRTCISEKKKRRKRFLKMKRTEARWFEEFAKVDELNKRNRGWLVDFKTRYGLGTTSPPQGAVHHFACMKR